MISDIVKKEVYILFHCQAEIEGNKKCKNQCKHCEEYYKPIDNVPTLGEEAVK